MKVNPQSVTLDGSGNGTVIYRCTLSGLQWDISQIAVSTVPILTGCTATVSQSGLYVCATATGSGDTAVGPPNIRLGGGDFLTVTWAAGPPGGNALATLTYDEIAGW